MTRMWSSVSVLALAGAMAVVYKNLRTSMIQDLLKRFQVATMAVLQASRLPQIFLNYKNRSVGTMSPWPWVSNFAGSLGRLYTAIVQLGGNPMLVRGFLASLLINGTIITQCILYD